MTRSSFSSVMGALLLALLALVVANDSYISRLLPNPVPVEAFAIRSERLIAAKQLLSREQSALVNHLSDKYRQPAALVERIVVSSYKEAKRFGLPPTLLLAIIMKESSLNPKARSGYGAIGLMQIVPRFHKEKLTDPNQTDTLHKPEENIRVGAEILAEYRELKGGNIRAALAKYSGSARGYADRVSQFRKELEAVSSNPA
ncbi:murein transglycosylase C [compost metagenome]